jgi:predicted PurR-regulated permease PerM
VIAPPAPGLGSLVSIVTGVTTIASLYLAREVLVPTTLAIILSFVLAPLVELLAPADDAQWRRLLVRQSFR